MHNRQELIDICQEFCTGCGLCGAVNGTMFEHGNKDFWYPNLQDSDAELCSIVCPAAGNAANNFQTNECLIAEIGPSKGIGKVIPPQVGNGLVYQAAVTPGHLYQAFKEEAVKQFPSGKFALALAGDYYQFYV